METAVGQRRVVTGNALKPAATRRILNPLAAIRKPFDVSRPACEVQLARWKKGKPLRCDLDQEVQAQEEGRKPAQPSKNKKRGWQ